MPDFVRNFVKGKRLKPEHLPQNPSEKLALIVTGTHKHFERDHQFHTSEYFAKSEADLKEIIKPVFQKLDIGRYWFAAHLLSEMMIDRVLMKQHPEMLDRFYHDLQATENQVIHEFLLLSNIEETEIFLQRLERFTSSQYLRQYVHDPAMVYSLNRIFMYTGAGEEWSKEQYVELQAMIPEIENTIFESLNHLIAEME